MRSIDFIVCFLIIDRQGIFLIWHVGKEVCVHSWPHPCTLQKQYSIWLCVSPNRCMLCMCETVYHWIIFPSVPVCHRFIAWLNNEQYVCCISADVESTQLTPCVIMPSDWRSYAFLWRLATFTLTLIVEQSRKDSVSTQRILFLVKCYWMLLYIT